MYDENVAFISRLTGLRSVAYQFSYRSTPSIELFVPRTRLSTIGDRAFQVMAARIWNCLPVSGVTVKELAQNAPFSPIVPIVNIRVCEVTEYCHYIVSK